MPYIRGMENNNTNTMEKMTYSDWEEFFNESLEQYIQNNSNK